MITIGSLNELIIYFDYSSKNFYKESKKINDGYIQIMFPIVTAFITAIFNIISSIFSFKGMVTNVAIIIINGILIYWVSKLVFNSVSNKRKNELESILVEDIFSFINTYIIQSWGQIIFLMVFLFSTIIFGALYLMNEDIKNLLMFNLVLLTTVTIKFYYNPFKKKSILKKIRKELNLG